MVFSSKRGKFFYSTKPSLTLRCVGGDWMYICRDMQVLGGVSSRPEGHQARGERIEDFEVTQTSQSHFVHLVV